MEKQQIINLLIQSLNFSEDNFNNEEISKEMIIENFEEIINDIITKIDNK